MCNRFRKVDFPSSRSGTKRPRKRVDFGGGRRGGEEPAGGDLQASSVSSAAELGSALTLRRGRESRYVHVMDFSCRFHFCCQFSTSSLKKSKPSERGKEEKKRRTTDGMKAKAPASLRSRPPACGSTAFFFFPQETTQRSQPLCARVERRTSILPSVLFLRRLILFSRVVGRNEY